MGLSVRQLVCVHPVVPRGATVPCPSLEWHVAVLGSHAKPIATVPAPLEIHALLVVQALNQARLVPSRTLVAGIEGSATAVAAARPQL